MIAHSYHNCPHCRQEIEITFLLNNGLLLDVEQWKEIKKKYPNECYTRLKEDFQTNIQMTNTFQRVYRNSLERSINIVKDLTDIDKTLTVYDCF